MTNTVGQLASVANFEHDLAGRDVCCGGRAFAAVEYDRHMGRRYTRPACDREKKLGVAFEILAQKRAFGGINLEIGRRTWLYAGDAPLSALWQPRSMARHRALGRPASIYNGRRNPRPKAPPVYGSGCCARRAKP